ncbi:hypothetical protein BCEP4_1530031 [Burkholderia cepacia]|nr:hypothetical protein BCEP4_1530031 [Burkholderia cepacia]
MSRVRVGQVAGTWQPCEIPYLWNFGAHIYSLERYSVERLYRVCLPMEHACEGPKSLAGQGGRSAVWPSQTSDDRRRHAGDFGSSRGNDTD